VTVNVKYRGLRRQPALFCSLALLIGLGGVAAPASAALLPTGPIVQLIDTQDQGDHTEITVTFACSARYMANTPVSHGTGTTITLALGPDCGTQFGTLPPELPLVGGGGSLVTGARVDSLIPGQITLELTWSKPLDFVMAPTASGLGLRVRLLNTNKKKGNVLVSETEPAAGYAVNLDSSLTPYPHETVEAVAASLQTQAYVSETDIENEHWYRLRVGPFTTRAEADRVLKIAQGKYPRAWVAVNDELTDLSAIERAGVASIAARPTDPPLPDEERTQILRNARVALEKHQYPESIDLLNRLLRQPEYPGRAEAQELMGLVRERAGQLAQAKAEYEEYLRRYPEGAGAARVRARLQALAAASLSAKNTGEFGAAVNNRFTMAGSAAVSYQYGKDQTITSGNTTTTNTLSSALVYGDLLLRDRGQRYDFTARVDAGYNQNIGSNPGGATQDRTTAAYVELTDKNFGLTGRLGRQSLASQGVIGLFDGLFVGYQVNPKVLVSAAAGLPAYTSYSALSSHQKFGTVTAEFDPWHQSWVFDTYFFDQIVDNQTDRRSVGFQTRYSAPGRTAVMLVDYDIAFRQLNSATLIGNAKVGQHWILSFDADHRRSPLLELDNALIGQTAPDLNTLSLQAGPPLTPSQIRQLALDRTATSNTVVFSATRSFGERWQFLADISGLELSSTPSSPLIGETFAADGVTVITPGVPAVAGTQSTGLDKNGALQLAGSSLLQASDLHIFSVRYDNSPLSRSTTLSWDARFVVHGAWRLGPRFSVEELNDPSLGGRQMLYLPQVRGDWTNRFSVFEVIAGYQLENQTTTLQQQSLTGQPQTTSVNQRSLFITAAYRVRF
jgi:hypothetical protein